MAYIKFKELTRYFRFSKEIDIETLPGYVTDYVDADEKIFLAYKTTRDKAVFTDKKIVLFDCNIFKGTAKTIHIIPYRSISTSAIQFESSSAKILITLDSGYQLRWDFTNMDPKAKTNLRLTYSNMMTKAVNSKDN